MVHVESPHRQGDPALQAMAEALCPQRPSTMPNTASPKPFLNWRLPDQWRGLLLTVSLAKRFHRNKLFFPIAMHSRFRWIWDPASAHWANAMSENHGSIETKIFDILWDCIGAHSDRRAVGRDSTRRKCRE
jgi:hypothetical protein